MASAPPVRAGTGETAAGSDAGESLGRGERGVADETAAPAAAATDQPAEADAPAPVAAATAVVASVPAVPPAMPAAPPVVPRFELPLDDLRSLAQGAGLEWVNSDADKVAAAQAAIAAQPAPVRVPRAPRPPVVLDEGPLVLVETRKDLSQLKLPFENDASRA